MIRRPPISTRTDTLFPYTTLFRSNIISCAERRIQIFISKADTALHKESEADDPWCVREALRIAAAEKRPKRICGLLIVPDLAAMMVVYEIERFDSEFEHMVVYAKDRKSVC